MSDAFSLIETQNLVKRFGDKLAVNNVGFEVHSGEVFGFLGPNGAGKTTTIKMIVGLLQPTSGVVKVADTTFNPNLWQLKQPVATYLIHRTCTPS